MLQQALNVFNLPYEIEGTTTTANYTLYKLRATGSGATLNRLQARLKDITAFLGKNVTIQADAGGVSLRIDNDNKKVYYYSDYNGYLNNNNYVLPFMLGLTENELLIDDLIKAPHLLIAGTTGSGKSSYLHTFILSMFNNADRVPLHMYLIDCKRVEFSIYNAYCNVYDNAAGASEAINRCINHIENKYEAMRAAGCNDFLEYRRRDPSAAYDVLIIDELADLISTKQAQRDIVPRLLRIAQIGRAAGVHMILATQRPDTTVINGTLKGNIPARISFNVATRFDSQVILDRGGAENLTGNGDGLYLKNGARGLVRFQSTYISMNELRKHFT